MGADVLLTDAHHRTLIRAGILMARHASHLSDFEVETVAAVMDRRRSLGREAATTAAEWAVVTQAVEAMEAAAYPGCTRPRRAA